MLSAYAKAKHRLARASLKIFVRWIRFSREHQHSRRLPFFLLLLLIADGFVTIIPSVLILVGSVTISPLRWKLFGFIFTFAGVFNNCIAYFVGRWISPDTLVWWIEKFHIEAFWQSAERALHTYGAYATFIGAIVGLPTQLIVILIGIADTQLLNSDVAFKSSFVSAIIFSLLGHGIKGFGIAVLARFGWIRLKKRVEEKTSHAA